MDKYEKKYNRLVERLDRLQKELSDSLTKKSNGNKEISIPEYQRKINEVRNQLLTLKK